MVKRTEPPRSREDACYITEGGAEYCLDPLGDMLGVLARRWTLLIVGVLGNRSRLRFNELKRSIPGLSARALSDRLSELAKLGLVDRSVDAAQVPPGVSYALSARGRGMRRALVPILQWTGGGPVSRPPRVRP